MATIGSFGVTEKTFRPPRMNYTNIQERCSTSFLFKSPWCCRLNIFRRKGIFVVLMLSVAGTCAFNYQISMTLLHEYGYLSNSVVLLYPVLGWLADVYFGRYRVIKFSLGFLWTVLILYGLFLVVWQILEFYLIVVSMPSWIDLAAKIIMLATLAFGVGSFQANIVQFGIDQLLDASSEDIKSFIQWYAWVFFGSQFIVGLTHPCLDDKYEVLIIAILLSIALCLDFFCNQWLVKEPESSNPLTVVFRVIKYAAKNKYPSLRSSFSYWDDKKYSRLDLAKTTFGGPFSTEQVEDVKTFLRILAVLFVGGFFAGMIAYVNNASDRLKNFVHCGSYSNVIVCTDKNDCFWMTFTNNFEEGFLIIFIPVFELALSPLLKRCFKGPILKKFAYGMVLVLLAVGGYGSLEAVHYNLSRQHNSTDITCLADKTIGYQPENVLQKGYLWIMGIGLVYRFGNYLLLIAACEFLCAQSPYSMKGLLFGLAYGVMGLSVAVNFAWLQLVQLGIEKWFLNSLVGCEALYSFSIFVVYFLLLLIFLCALKCYRIRRRGEEQGDNKEYFERSSSPDM